MKCKHPIVFKNTGNLPIPCGRCLPCTVTKRRVWTHRMMLEAGSHVDNCFVTLTYSDDNLPTEWMDEKTGQIWPDFSLNPNHLKAFIKKLARQYYKKYGKKIRYFACGEYGEKTGRPHYHLAIFGVPPCSGSGHKTIAGRFYPCQCPNCSFISEIWAKGHVTVDRLESASAAYVAGYVTKKLTKNDAWTLDILCGRHPEFARMSRNKGLGYQAIWDFAPKIFPFVETWDDIPPYFVHNGKKWPLGRYLRKTLGLFCGLTNLDGSEIYKGENIDNYKKNLQDLFENKVPVAWSEKALKGGLPDVALKLLNAQSALQLEKQFERKSYGDKKL
nr:MAG: replication initiator protein [Microvirus sp.]